MTVTGPSQYQQVGSSGPGLRPATSQDSHVHAVMIVFAIVSLLRGAGAVAVGPGGPDGAGGRLTLGAEGRALGVRNVPSREPRQPGSPMVSAGPGKA